MIPDPLHPAIVHFPIVLAMLFPLAIAGALWVIHRGVAFRHAWLVPVIFAVMLTASAWVATETGEGEEDRAESVVPESAIHEHEEAAEWVLIGAWVTLALAGGGLVAGRAGAVLRGATAVGSLLLVAATFQTGRLGGELVYRYGAGAAYTAPGTTDPPE